MNHGKWTNLGTILVAGTMGAGLMYILDPNRGRTRRALLRDKVVRGINVLRCRATQQLRNAAHHLIGGAEEIKSSLRDRSQQVSDNILLERVRAQIGRAVRHFGVLNVAAQDGFVIVEGPVLVGEANRMRRRLGGVRGVRDYDVRVHEVSEDAMQRMSGAAGFPPTRAAL